MIAEPDSQTRAPAAATRTVFRPASLRRHSLGRDGQVLPRFVSPRTFLCLWILLGLLLIEGGLVLLTRVPVSVSGSAVVTAWRGAARGDHAGQEVVVAFLPAAALPRLRVGQSILLSGIAPLGAGEPATAAVRGAIVAVLPAIVSPAQARLLFALDGGTALAVRAPSAVAIARLAQPVAGVPASHELGSIFSATVVVGSRHLLSLAPLAGQTTGE